MFKTEKCIVEAVMATQVVSDKFKKRELWVKFPNADKPEWSKYAAFVATQDRVSLLDALSVGDEVSVSFAFDGRPYDKKDGSGVKLFNSINIISIDIHTKSGKTMEVTKEMAAEKQPMSAKDIGNGPADDAPNDLPF